jgi:hypothetical protein
VGSKQCSPQTSKAGAEEIQMTALLNYWLKTPLKWLRDYFSRPTEFYNDTSFKLDLKDFWLSALCLLRLIPIVSTVGFVPALVLRIGLLWLNGQFPTFSTHTIVPLLLPTALGCLGGMAVALAFGLITGKNGIISFLLIGAITADIPFGGTLGIIQNITANLIPTLILLPLFAGIATILGAEFFMYMRQKKLLALQEIVTIFLVIAIGVFLSLLGVLAMAYFHLPITPHSEQEYIWSLALENLLVGFLLSYILSPWGWLFGLPMLFIILAIQISLYDPTPHLIFLFLPTISFFAGYLLGYLHMPISLYRYLSMWHTYNKSNASRTSNTFSPQVFSNLKGSALYKDERVKFWLPWLAPTLAIAVEQDRSQARQQNAAFPDFGKTMEIINYIVLKRPALRRFAYAIIVDIILVNLKECTNTRAIAWASKQCLDNYLSSEPGLIYPAWITTFKDLNDVSKEASRYMSTNNRQQKQTLLDDMLTHLNEIQKNPPRTSKHTETLAALLKVWEDSVEEERKLLNNTIIQAGSFGNHYIPGRPFTGDDGSLYRRAIFKELLEEIFPPGKNIPPTYATRLHIVGEPGTGKTSILHQLADKLKPDYLLVTYGSDILAGEDTLFNSLAEKIYRTIDPSSENLQPFMQIGKRAENYSQFNDWLKQVEQILEHKKRTLILAFDNLEMPEISDEKRPTSELLLDWFHSIELDYPRIVLLLCGTQRTNEINRRWARYLAKFRTLPISFLEHNEAANLITHFAPKPDFFDAAARQEIIRLTNGHPLLLQAFCSTMIEHLNANLVGRATLDHIENAPPEFYTKFYKTWGEAYFGNLSKSFDPDQEMCLRQLAEKGGKDSKTSLDHLLGGQKDSYLRSTLKPLVERDILREDKDYYEITIPLLCTFMKR